MTAHRNLTSTAISEFDGIIEDSADYGPIAVEKTLDRLTAVFAEIDRGQGLGHRRDDLGFGDHILFRGTKPLPFLVIYDRRSNVVLRVVHGKRLYADLIIEDFRLFDG